MGSYDLELAIMKNFVLFARLEKEYEEKLDALQLHEASKTKRTLTRTKLVKILINECFESRNLTTPDSSQQSS
jgi:uncharacterized protein YktA (UPF0223 family)